MADQVDLTVPAEMAGERVDKAVAHLLAVSRAVARTLVEGGAELDGEPCSARDRISEGQVITVDRPSDEVSLVPEPVDFDVLAETDSYVVVDKPPGLVVHPGSGATGGTLAAGLLYRYPALEGVGAHGRWGLVHRLDRDTSGVLLVARTARAFDSLVDQLRRREIERHYLTLVEGALPAATGTIEAPIARDPVQPTRRAVAHGGKDARTHYEVSREFSESGVTLAEVTLETGRTHQIRVHMSAIGHPVAGDWTYGASRRDLGLARMFLHARRLKFGDPESGEPVIVESPLPADLEACFSALSD